MSVSFLNFILCMLCKCLCLLEILLFYWKFLVRFFTKFLNLPLLIYSSRHPRVSNILRQLCSFSHKTCIFLYLWLYIVVPTSLIVSISSYHYIFLCHYTYLYHHTISISFPTSRLGTIIHIPIWVNNYVYLFRPISISVSDTIPTSHLRLIPVIFIYVPIIWLVSSSLLWDYMNSLYSYG